MIADSPALQSREREREILARHTASLAALIADDTAADGSPIRGCCLTRPVIPSGVPAAGSRTADPAARFLVDGALYR
jgi:hypothetical protein